MSFLLKLEFNNKIKNAVSKDIALERLGDINKIAELHPKVKSVENMYDNSWKWTMSPSGARGSYFDIVYGCSYTIDKKTSKISWLPVEGVGNAVVSGHWEIFDKDAEIELNISINVPFPEVFSTIANQIANKVFSLSMKKHLKQLEDLLK